MNSLDLMPITLMKIYIEGICYLIIMKVISIASKCFFLYLFFHTFSILFTSFAILCLVIQRLGGTLSVGKVIFTVVFSAFSSLPSLLLVRGTHTIFLDGERKRYRVMDNTMWEGGGNLSHSGCVIQGLGFVVAEFVLPCHQLSQNDNSMLKNVTQVFMSMFLQLRNVWLVYFTYLFMSSVFPLYIYIFFSLS